MPGTRAATGGYCESPLLAPPNFFQRVGFVSLPACASDFCARPPAPNPAQGSVLEEREGEWAAAPYAFAEDEAGDNFLEFCLDC